MELGFGAAETVRTTKTKREEHEEKSGEPAQKNQKEKNRELDSNLSDLRLKYGAQLEWGKLYGGLITDGKIAQFAWKNQQVVLFMSTVNDGQKVVNR